MSKALLDHLSLGGTLTVGGLPWTLEDRPLSPNAFASKMLCERHNSALSLLDSVAVRFFQACDERDAANSKQNLLYLFSGHDVERWLLKTLCGLSASKSLTVGDVIDVAIPLAWQRVLFDGAPFDSGSGLYMCRSVGHEFVGPRGVQMRAIVDGERLTGLGVFLCGYEFILSLSSFPARVFDGREVVYRPFELHTIGPGFEKSVCFSWDGPADMGTVSLRLPNLG